jgi:hypothetical protein
MAFSTYNVFIHKPIYANSMSDHTIMLWSIMAGIDDMKAELREEIGNKRPIFQIQYVI